MNIFRDLESIPAGYKGAVVALGNFDGVHRGHQEILQLSIASARAYGVPAAVMTFAPHPREFFSKTRDGLRLTGLRSKILLLEEMGIDTLFLVRFNRRFAALSPADFVENVLHRRLGVRHVVTGYDFAFGKDRGGGTDFLETQAHRFGFGFTACPPVSDAGDVISSSAIRRLLAAGDMHKAAALLGRPYAIEGRVRHGDKRGRELGMPTANIALGRLFKPRFGIYAVRVTLSPPTLVGGSMTYDAVASLGIRPMFAASEPLLEVHIFGMNQDIYGQRIRVTLMDFLRDEQAFDSIDALKNQMQADALRAKELLHARQ